MSRFFLRRMPLAILLLLTGACQKVDRTTSPSPSALPRTADPPVVVTSLGIEMVLIPAGRFFMGRNDSDPDQQPAHEVEISAFLIDRYEVTQAAYAQLDPINGSHFKGPELPTEMVSWGKAALYCNLRSEAEGLEPCYNEFGECDFEADGYRLPTEAEWEYACRAGSAATYGYGADSGQLAQYAWYTVNSGKKTHAVGKKQPNAWGLYDMHGNVAEWCNDFYAPDYYQHSPAKNPTGPDEGEKNVLRGGHWAASADACGSAYRCGEEPGFSDACFARDAIGFRCVRQAPTELQEQARQKRNTRVLTAFTSSSGRDLQHQLAAGKENPDAVPLPPAEKQNRRGSPRRSKQDDRSGEMGMTTTPVTAQEQFINDPRKGARVGFVFGEIFLRHDTGSAHPERSERLTAIVRRLTETGLLDDLTVIEPRPADESWLTTVHTSKYLQELRQLCELGGGHAGSLDTPVSQQSYAAAVQAAGGVLAAVDFVIEGKVKSAFCAVRPPGHHAMRNRAMGFCLLNNVAIAARYIQQKHQLKNVLIVDWDVHHGNGTQATFLDDASVFYFSVHRYPFYPGTGTTEQRGTGPGMGATLNVPLAAGSGNREFQQAIEQKLVPAATNFKPDFVLISAGFDAHEDDPLGGMNVTAEGYAQLTRTVRQIAETHCQGRMVSVLEGGYDLEGLASSVEAHVRVLGE